MYTVAHTRHDVVIRGTLHHSTHITFIVIIVYITYPYENENNLTGNKNLTCRYKKLNAFPAKAYECDGFTQ